MDLNLLTLFAEIVESPSLSAAARRIGVTRSHVGQRLQALERELGAQLMRRTTRRLALTDVGQTVYEHALRIRQEAEAAAAAAVGRVGIETAGVVRVSIPTGLGRLIVAPLLVEFQRQYARVDLSVRFANRIDDLVAAHVDVALKVGANAPDDCVARELGRITWCLCAAPAYLAARAPIRKVADLTDHCFVCPPVPGRRLTLRASRAASVIAIPRVQSEDFCFLLDAINAGIGIGLMPHYLVQGALDAGSLLSILPDEKFENAGEKLFLLTTRSRYPSPAQRALIEFLVAHLISRHG